MMLTIEEVKKYSDDIAGHFDGKEFNYNIDFIVGVSRGGVVPAALIATKLVKPLVFIYIDKYDNVYFDRSEWIFAKNVLLIDDIIRTGKTLNLMKAKLEHCGANKVYTATVGLIGQSLNKNYHFYCVQEKENDIIFPWDYDRK